MSRSRHGSEGGAPLKVVQVGLGGWGRSWAAEVREHPSVARPVGYVDVVPEMRAALQQELPVDAAACFPSLAEALAATDAEAVLVTTALPGHATVAIEALEAGRHVLVEKPMAPTLADARAMVDAARRAGRTLMVSQNYRFFPAPRVVRELIANRELGALGAVTVSFRRNDNSADPRHHRHYFLPDPLLLDMSIHHFDLMRFVLGQEGTRIFTVARDPGWSHYVGAASAVATIGFDGGTLVDYRGSWVSTAPKTAWAGEWVMECEGGVIRWTSREDWTDAVDAVTVQPFGGEERSLELPKLRRVDRAGSLEEFWSAIREHRAPLTSGESNLNTLALALGAIESAATCQPVHLDPEIEPPPPLREE